MTDISKKLALGFRDLGLLEEYYQKLSGLFLPARLTSKGLILDLNSLPTEPVDFKTTFILWMLEVNRPRIKDGQEPVITLELALKCPIWKMIKAPLKRVKLTDERLINRPSVKTIGQKRTAQNINK